MNRRKFVSYSTAASAAVFSAWAQSSRLPIRKGILIGMLPRSLSYADRFKLAKDCGFQSIEGQTVHDPAVAEEIRKASESAGIPIHSVMNMGHWENPFSSNKPEMLEKGHQAMQTSLRNAKLWGAETVLLVPAVVNPETSYQDAWTRSQAEIRKLIPLAAELKVVIAIEEVWNKFLLSPLEFARYVDQFNSQWVKAYFDVGNVVLYGYPQDWIRTLGKRIVKLHIKDFSFRKRVAEFGALREGDIDWKAIHKALSDIGYRGDATLEVSGGGEPELRELNRRFDLILEGA